MQRSPTPPPPLQPKRSLFGVGVNPTNYQECLQWVLWAAHNRTSGCVDHMPVHGHKRRPIFDIATLFSS
jgi:hypothetical protein